MYSVKWATMGIILDLVFFVVYSDESIRVIFDVTLCCFGYQIALQFPRSW